MRFQRSLPSLAAALALTVGASVPALAQQAGVIIPHTGMPATTSTVTTTVTTTVPVSTMAFPVATVLGQGWYAAASSLGANGFMVRQSPIGDNVSAIQGQARIAVIDGARDMGAMTAATTPQSTSPLADTDRLITSVAQWTDPTDNSQWEVRILSIDPNTPFGGVGVMRAQHGTTGIGISQFPAALSYISLYGPAMIMRNGQTVASNLPAHMLVSQGIRDPQTGRMLQAGSVRPDDIQIHVFVQGNIPGRTENFLYAFWPQATLDTRNLGAPVALLPEEIQVAQSLFGGDVAVAGVRETVTPALMPLLMVSLQDDFLARSTPQVNAGDVEVRVINDSTMPRGFYIEGPGLTQRTQLLQPGQMATFTVRMMPGSYRLASFTRPNPDPEDYMHLDMIQVR